MLGSISLRSPAAAITASDHLAGGTLGRRTMACVALRNYDSIPKRETFTSRRSLLDEVLKDRTFLQKTKDELTDYCTTLEGDDCCNCWSSYFELKELEKELPREDVERIVREAGGLKSLISWLHGITVSLKLKDKKVQKVGQVNLEPEIEKPFPVPDGLPKTQEELDEEEEALMPESNFTRLLRRMGKYPAWYTPRPDHETD